MALSISYFTGTDRWTKLCYGQLVASVSVSLTGSSASCGTVPAGANIARVKGGEACLVSNNGAAASTTNGVNLAFSEVIDIQVEPGAALYAKTA